MRALADAGGSEHIAYRAEALLQEEVDAIVADVIDRCGRFDILINGVGGSTIIPGPGAAVETLRLDSGLGGTSFSGLGEPEPVKLGAGLDDVGAEGEAVDGSGGEPRIVEGLASLGERSVGGDGDGRALFPLGQDLE